MGYEVAYGTTIHYSTDSGTTYDQILKVNEIGEFGLDGSFDDTTSLEDTVKEYDGGLMDTPDFPITFKEVVGDLVQAAFLSEAENLSKVMIKIEFPSGTTVELNVALSGYKTATSSGRAVHTVNGKQSGAPVWTRA